MYASTCAVYYCTCALCTFSLSLDKTAHRGLISGVELGGVELGGVELNRFTLCFIYIRPQNTQYKNNWRCHFLTFQKGRFFVSCSILYSQCMYRTYVCFIWWFQTYVAIWLADCVPEPIVLGWSGVSDASVSTWPHVTLHSLAARPCFTCDTWRVLHTHNY